MSGCLAVAFHLVSLFNEWESYGHHADCYYTKDLFCYHLTSGKFDSQFEAPLPCKFDTRTFFQAAQFGDSHPVVLDFEDIDV